MSEVCLQLCVAVAAWRAPVCCLTSVCVSRDGGAVPVTAVSRPQARLLTRIFNLYTSEKTNKLLVSNEFFMPLLVYVRFYTLILNLFT